MDIFMEETDLLSVRWENRRVENIVQGSDSGVGLRLMFGDETRLTHVDCRHPVTEGLRAPETERLVSACQELAGSAVSLPVSFRPVSRPLRRHPIRRPPQNIPLKDKIHLLRQMDRIARRFPAVRQVTISYGERIRDIAYWNSSPTTFREGRTYVVMAIQVTVADGKLLQTATEVIGGLQGFELMSESRCSRLAEMTARRAVSKLKSPPAPLGEMAVVIASSSGGTLIHEAVGHSLEADAIRQGTSPHYAGKIGRTVASPLVTVVDDPTRPGSRGSFIFDDEGVPSRKTVLIDRGVLKTYLYDRKTARQCHRAPNGHGRRESYAHKPIPRMSNTYVVPGPHDPKEIIASVDKGLLVTRMGGGQVNTATGDFVFEVEEGYRIDRGQPAQMVRGANLLGNGPQVLRSIDRVGTDLGWAIGTCGKDGQGVPVSDGLPTVRIPTLIVGGTTAD
ncbi:MAG TPA: TldD/PmbA family protein [Elusimicrobiota bacterium]|nr:TldD/PmbA family protein [Elusimicrobiota bacterium]